MFILFYASYIAYLRLISTFCFELYFSCFQNKVRKPKIKAETPPTQTKLKDYSITEKLLFDNLVDQSMPPHGFLGFKPNEKSKTVNDFIILSTMEEELRTAAVCNEEGL